MHGSVPQAVRLAVKAQAVRGEMVPSVIDRRTERWSCGAVTEPSRDWASWLLGSEPAARYRARRRDGTRLAIDGGGNVMAGRNLMFLACVPVILVGCGVAEVVNGHVPYGALLVATGCTAGFEWVQYVRLPPEGVDLSLRESDVRLAVRTAGLAIAMTLMVLIAVAAVVLVAS